MRPVAPRGIEGIALHLADTPRPHRVSGKMAMPHSESGLLIGREQVSYAAALQEALLPINLPANP